MKVSSTPHALLKAPKFRHICLLNKNRNFTGVSTSRIDYNVAEGEQLQLATWAPVGTGLVYVFKNNIYYITAPENVLKPERITSDGVEGVIYNGVPDWVYEGLYSIVRRRILLFFCNLLIPFAGNYEIAFSCWLDVKLKFLPTLGTGPDWPGRPSKNLCRYYLRYDWLHQSNLTIYF